MSRPRRSLPQGLAREGLKCGVCGHEQYADNLIDAVDPMSLHMAQLHSEEKVWIDHLGRRHVI